MVHDEHDAHKDDDLVARALRLLQLPKKQGVPDSVKRGAPWISPSLYNHGISKGVPACTLDTGETNALYLKDDAHLQGLIRAIQENQVEWRFPEETAIPHLYCLLLRGRIDEANALAVLIMRLQSEHCVRFFPRRLPADAPAQPLPCFFGSDSADAPSSTTATSTHAPRGFGVPVGGGGLSDLTVREALRMVKNRRLRVEQYVLDLQRILDGYNKNQEERRHRRARRHSNGSGAPPKKEQEEKEGTTTTITKAQKRDREEEGVRLQARIATEQHAQAQLKEAMAFLRLRPADRGLSSADVDALSTTVCGDVPCMLPVWERLRTGSLEWLADRVGLEVWTARVIDYAGLAGAPTLSGDATPLEQFLSDQLFLLVGRVPRAFNIGVTHQRVSRTSFPWHIPADPDRSAKEEMRSRIKALLGCFLSKYPGRVMPNRLVQTVHDLLKATTGQPNQKEGEEEENDLLPLKTIAEDLFGAGHCELSERYVLSARKALDLVLLLPNQRKDDHDDGTPTLSYYARMYKLDAPGLIDRIRASTAMPAPPDVKASIERLQSAMAEHERELRQLYPRRYHPLETRSNQQLQALIQEKQALITAHAARLHQLKQPLAHLARELIGRMFFSEDDGEGGGKKKDEEGERTSYNEDDHGGSSFSHHNHSIIMSRRRQEMNEHHLNAIYVLTVPLMMAAIQLGCLNEADGTAVAYARGTWTYLNQTYVQEHTPRTLRRLAPVVANLRLALSLLTNTDTREQLIAEFHHDRSDHDDKLPKEEGIKAVKKGKKQMHDAVPTHPDILAHVFPCLG